MNDITNSLLASHLTTPYIFVRFQKGEDEDKSFIVDHNEDFINFLDIDNKFLTGKSIDELCHHENGNIVALFSKLKSYFKQNKYLPENININNNQVEISSYRPDETSIIFFFGTNHAEMGDKKGVVNNGHEDIENEKKFRKLFNMYADAVFLIEKDSGQILETNIAVQKIYQYRKEESLKMKNTDFSAEPDATRKALLNKFEKVLLRWHKKKDGTVFPVEITASNFTWNGRDVQIAVCRDVTERIEDQKNLLDFERIFTLSPNPISISTLEGAFVKVNPAFEKVLGYKSTEMEGKNVLDFVYEEDIHLTNEAIQKAVRNKDEILIVENRYKCKDGTLVWFSWRSQAIYKDGIAYSIAHDITKLKEIENELIEAKNKAEESDKLKSAFLANMSHEIRTPMNGIVGFANLLKDKSLSDEKREKYIHTINASSNQLLGIISDIVDISKIESGLVNLFYKEHNLNRILNELYEQFELELELKSKQHIKLTISTSLPNEQSNIITDEIRIKQIYTNLVTNAIKFTNQGNITYGYETEGKYLVLFVKDSGIGVPKKDQSVIFDRFRQAEEVEKKLMGGTGLGLSICKGIVDLMHGDIWLNSKQGNGAEFFVKIPLHKPQKSIEINSPMLVEKKDQFDWSNYTVLIVEDVENIRLYLSEILLPTHIHCLFATKGQHAIKIYQERDDIDLILMDIQLPDISGYEVTKQIRKHNKKIPIIAQTAYAMAGDREEALKAGCNNYIAKPIKKDKLLSLINMYLR